MKRYYFKTEDYTCVPKGYRKRGYNRLISVYEMAKGGNFHFIGDEWINTASYKGDYAIACDILNKEKKHRMGASGYDLESKNIKLIKLP